MESTQDPRTWIPQPIYGHKGSKRMKLVGFLDIVPIFLKATSSYSIIFPPEIEKIDVLDSPSPLDLSRFTQLYPDFLMNPPVEIPISPDPNQGPGGPWGPLGAPDSRHSSRAHLIHPGLNSSSGLGEFLQDPVALVIQPAPQKI